ncbi:MAG: hypothetical protein JSU65_08280 [Candidatus Zixiibacteriota bacterium]|nr:MAG: hypothetical protein JSU65_08280 [candidate division Zixibacteria bacterium]
MKYCSFLCLLFLGVIVCMPQSEAFEFLTSRGDGLGGCLLLEQTSAPALVSVPTGGIKDREWKVEAAYNRKFDLSALDDIFLAGAWRHRSVSMALGLQQFGQTDYYAERTLKVSGAYHYDSVSVGLSVSGMLIDIGSGYGRLKSATFGVGASYRHGRWFLALAADDLNTPRLYETSPGLKPRVSLYGELVGKGSFSVLGRSTFQRLEKPQFGLGQRLRLSSGSAFFWGLSTAPLKYGGGLDLRIDQLMITYSTSIHPELGLTHTLSIAYGGPKPPREGDEFD